MYECAFSIGLLISQIILFSWLFNHPVKDKLSGHIKANDLMKYFIFSIIFLYSKEIFKLFSDFLIHFIESKYNIDMNEKVFGLPFKNIVLGSIISTIMSIMLFVLYKRGQL